MVNEVAPAHILLIVPSVMVGNGLTTMVFDTLLTVLLQAPPVMFVTVMVALPAVVKPVAVNVPVPAVVTVIVAVKPVAEGELLL